VVVLVEFAGREQPTRRHQYFVEFIDDRRLADAGIARDEHQLRRPAQHHAVEGGEQALDLLFSPV
jgi:hypothetical protein